MGNTQINTKILKTRYDYIDLIRVFSICMVIILHCIYGYYNDVSNAGKSLWFALGFVNELSRVGVPLFFMISGFLLLNKDIGNIKEFYKKRLIKIGIPFIIYNICYYIYFTSYRNEISVFGFIKELLNSGSAYHLWFIYSILFLYLMVPFVKMVVDKCSLKMLILLVIIITFQTTLKPFFNTFLNENIYVFLTEDGVCGYLGYMVLGYLLGKYNFPAKTNLIIYILGIISFVVMPIISMRSVVNTGEYLFSNGYAINHYIEAMAIFIFCKNNLNKKSKIIARLSSVTMGAYFIHVFILEELKNITWTIRPVILFMIWMIVTILLSFLWGFIESKLVEIIKGVCKKC